MGAPLTECQVRLYRDSLTTPWGFRLQGGKDFKAPLSVQRVFVGSPADGELHRGDIILSINSYDVTQQIHKQAMDIIKDAGGTMTMHVRRRPFTSPSPAPALISPTSIFHVEIPQYFRSRPLNTKPMQRPNPAGTQFAVDYSRGKLPATQMYYSDPHTNYPGYTANNGAYYDNGTESALVNDLQRSLNSTLWSAEEAQGEEEYRARSVKEIAEEFKPPRKAYTNQPQYNIYATQPRHRSVNPQTAWTRPDPHLSAAAPPSEPGWTPKWNPVRAPSYGTPAQQYRPAPVNRPPPVNRPHSQPAQRPIHYDSERPAWKGSLKQSGSVKPWEGEELPAHQAPETHRLNYDGGSAPVHQPRVQHFHTGPGGDVTYQQHAQAPDSDTAQVKHLQYNSPLGLYSKDNVHEVLEGQTRGKPGHGTMQVTSTPGTVKTFDPNHSEVLKLLQEEESHRRGRQNQPQSARYAGPDQHQEMHYAGYVDHSKQSPAMGRLEQVVTNPGGHGEHHNQGEDEYGISDF